VQKVNYFTNNKWMKLDVCENEDGDLSVNQIDQTTMFKKRGGMNIYIYMIKTSLVFFFII